jgi:hypothetical protein
MPAVASSQVMASVRGKAATCNSSAATAGFT